MTQPLQSPSDPYEYRTYQVLMRRGVPQADAIKKAQSWGALKRTDPTGETLVGPADNPIDRLDQPRIETNPITGQREFKAPSSRRPRSTHKRNDQQRLTARGHGVHAQ